MKTRRNKILVLLTIVIFIFAVFILPIIKYNIIYFRDIWFAKSYFIEIISNDKPTEDFKDYLLPQYKSIPEKNVNTEFYFWKIWFWESNIQNMDIIFSFSSFFEKTDNCKHYSLNYGRDNPQIHYFIENIDGVKGISARFNLNNCFFSPDFNDDEKIDSIDFQLAKLKSMNK